MTGVLCEVEFLAGGTWRTDVICVHVDSSVEILEAVDDRMRKRQLCWLPRISDWRVVKYLPEHGRPRF